jgi:hypothetical protein
LAEGFQRRRLKCEKLTDDGRQTMDDGRQVMAKAGELKRGALDSHPQVIKFTSGFLQVLLLLPPLKLVAMI